MMQYTEISLDLETWGKRAGCDLRSIGATVFHPYQIDAVIPPRNSPAQFYQAVENPVVAEVSRLPDGSVTVAGLRRVGKREYNLFRDPDTVQWWSEQSAEAQAAFANPVDLLDGLMLFKEWLDQVAPVPKQTRIWAHGAHFDIPILEAAFHAVGMEAPWFYRAPRDTRTIFDASNVIDHSAYLTSFAQGDEVYHHALDDAIVQARAIASSMRFLRSWINAIG